MLIQDTLSDLAKNLEALERVRIYLCGVTVYDESHIGHARTVIVFDVLRRYLEDLGLKVDIVQNFTDVDDKIIDRAKIENTSASEISSRYIKSYFEDFDLLNVRRASTYPKATEHIPDIIEFIKNLIEHGVAYTTKNGVYFSVSKFRGYGKLSKKNIEQLQIGARITVDETKDDPLDFAVWKFSDVEPAWPSPWGRGRPGWHIECSVMSTKYLGDNFDIHGGGRDLIFPHHENEIAQYESCTKSTFAKIWMHVGMVTIDGQKMSKSLGNVRSIKGLLRQWGPNVIRLFCLSSHYSKPVDYTENLLGECLTKWRQVEICFYELTHAVGNSDDETAFDIARKCKEKFNASLECDFNTHQALSSLFFLVREVNRLGAEERLGSSAEFVKVEFVRMLCILGLDMPGISDAEKTKINCLVSDREKLRQEKKFNQADKIRDVLNEMNVELIDHKERTIWVRREDIRRDK